MQGFPRLFLSFKPNKRNHCLICIYCVPPSPALICVLSLDPTSIVGPPQNTRVVSGTTAQLVCKYKYDKSLQDSFELLWTKNDEKIPLSAQKNSR